MAPHIYYLLYQISHSVFKLACSLLQIVPETLPEEVLSKMGAPPKDDSVPIITADKLPEADGIIFGIPTRFGMAAAQMKSFMDSTGGLWQEGKLMGKPAGVFFSTATQVSWIQNCRSLVSLYNRNWDLCAWIFITLI